MPRYATIGNVTLAPGKRAIAEGVADQGGPSMMEQPGIESVVFFLDESRNYYAAFSIWESREAAEAGLENTTPLFEQAFGDHLDGPIETAMFEIYETKGG